MGEIADMMLDGTLCERCGEYLGTDNGYPTYCASCANEIEVKFSGVGKKEKVSCPHCKKRVKKIGLSDHIRDAHPETSLNEHGDK